MDTYQRRMVDATPAADLWVPSWLLWSNDTSAECWSWIFWKHHFGVPSIEDTGTNLDTYFHIFLSIKRHGLRDILYNDIIIWYVTCIYIHTYTAFTFLLPMGLVSPHRSTHITNILFLKSARKGGGGAHFREKIVEVSLGWWIDWQNVGKSWMIRSAPAVLLIFEGIRDGRHENKATEISFLSSEYIGNDEIWARDDLLPNYRWGAMQSSASFQCKQPSSKLACKDLRCKGQHQQQQHQQPSCHVVPSE